MVQFASWCVNIKRCRFLIRTYIHTYIHIHCHLLSYVVDWGCEVKVWRLWGRGTHLHRQWKVVHTSFYKVLSDWVDGWRANESDLILTQRAESSLIAKHKWPFRREVHSRCRLFPLAFCADKEATGWRRQFFSYSSPAVSPSHRLVLVLIIQPWSNLSQVSLNSHDLPEVTNHWWLSVIVDVCYNSGSFTKGWIKV